YYAQRQRPAAG
ncbi:transposase, partial [Mycobacterium tuberculosis 49375]